MASGDMLAEWTAVAYSPPASTFASLAFISSQPVLTFDPTVREDAWFQGVLPSHYTGGGLTVTVVWTAPINTGNCGWALAIERQATAHPLSSSSFSADRISYLAAPATANNLKYDTIAFTNGTQMDSLAINERFRLRVAREATNASDTMTTDAYLVAVFMRET